MRFALLGDHPDGLEAARAAAASGRHQLVVYSGPAAGLEYLARDGLAPARVGDIEEALADPNVDAVIVAGAPSQRAAQLRRSLQSEHHVLCVHPVDASADAAYEAAMLQADVRRALVPLLAEALHPGVQRLAELARIWRGVIETTADDGLPLLPANFPRVLEFERWSGEEVLLGGDDRPHLPGWDALRAVGGEIVEVTALARGLELVRGEPVLLSGRFARGTLLQTTLLPRQERGRWRLTLVSERGRAELAFDDDWPGPATLRYVDEHGAARVESWPAWHPWPAVLERFEEAVSVWRSRREPPRPGRQDPTCLTQEMPRLGWLDAIRGLELDDAVRRSVERRRASGLDFQEATEEAGFKGTMTLVGCGLLWISLLLLILSMWAPMLGWAILPIFGLFLVLQFFRWAVPPRG
jgi:hypothetical protein